MKEPVIYIVKSEKYGNHSWYFDDGDARILVYWQNADYPDGKYYIQETNLQDIPYLYLNQVRDALELNADYFPPAWIEYGIKEGLIKA
jgi:hypothetical protein